MKTLGLRWKLIIAFLMAGILPMLAISTYTYYKNSSALKESSIDKFQALGKARSSGVTLYFETIRDQVLTFADDVMIRDAMREFNGAFDKFNDQTNVSRVDLIAYKNKLRKFYVNEFESKYLEENGKSIDSKSLLNQLSPTELALQYHYIGNNSNPLGSKDALDFVPDSSDYSKLHKKYHPSVRNYLQKFGYYDIFLVDIDSGHIVYSVFKELDYATSLLNGPFSGTNFAEAFKKAKEITKKDEAILVDYKKYTPSYEAPASFIATPIWDANKKIGVAIFQMPIDRLNSIMADRSGMGETGETFLVGPDYLPRSDVFRDPENRNVVTAFKKPTEGIIKTEAIEMALSGKEGAIVATDYLGNEAIIAYTPFKLLGQHNWALISKIDTEEAFQASNEIEAATAIVFFISILAISLLSYFLSKSISDSLLALARRLNLSAGNVGSSSSEIASSSSTLSESVSSASSSLQETVTAIDEISSMVQRSSEAAKKSTKVSSKSTEAATQGKKTVESMIQSIKEISDSNQKITSEMQTSNQEISKIVHVISEIGEKTKVINDIVFQTKLLSFNASVEAARAGEHGKGFAVVAEEVGNLASMSGKAALEITEMLETSIKQVTEIVDNTKSNVESLVQMGKSKVEVGTKTAHQCDDALNEIIENVSKVNDMVQEISTASSEQSIGVQEVTKALQKFDQLTQQNSMVAKQSSSLGSQLNEHALSLDKTVRDLVKIINGKTEAIQMKTSSPTKLEVLSKGDLEPDEWDGFDEQNKLVS